MKWDAQNILKPRNSDYFDVVLITDGKLYTKRFGIEFWWSARENMRWLLSSLIDVSDWLSSHFFFYFMPWTFSCRTEKKAEQIQNSTEKHFWRNRMLSMIWTNILFRKIHHLLNSEYEKWMHWIVLSKLMHQIHFRIRSVSFRFRAITSLPFPKENIINFGGAGWRFDIDWPIIMNVMKRRQFREIPIRTCQNTKAIEVLE